ncbi:hypothetical protein BKA70DRAFT_1332045, partial [Coprinopsis sp. MPI-PUGE-AT-0042]
MAAIDESPTYLAIKEHDLDKLAQVMSGTLEDEWYDIGEAIAVAAELDPAKTSDHLRLLKRSKLPEWTAYHDLLDGIKKLWYIHQAQPAPETTVIGPQTATSLGACFLDVRGENSFAMVQIWPEKSPRGSSIQLFLGLTGNPGSTNSRPLVLALPSWLQETRFSGTKPSKTTSTPAKNSVMPSGAWTLCKTLLVSAFLRRSKRLRIVVGSLHYHLRKFGTCFPRPR